MANIQNIITTSTSTSIWQKALDTTHTTTSIHATGEINQEQLDIMVKIFAMREKYNLTSEEFLGVLGYIATRGNYLDNFTRIEDIYFETAVRMLKKEELDQWIGKKMCTELNPTNSTVIGTSLVAVVEAMRDKELKTDDMFALAHKTLYSSIEPFKHSSCAMILNTLKATQAQAAPNAQTATNPPGDM